ncbi:MAG: phosphoglycolate phosphatase [Burkholderiales bacterium]|jgi:phosphoglycolate phosphatase|nr:phosphoglycolate phosphatase [Burkholderiales bacterium]
MGAVRAVLLDLDGTLVDSAADLAAAANRMLAALGLPARTVDEVKTYVGKGIPRLVHRALTGRLDGEADGALHARALALFEQAYAEESGRHSAVFAGVVAGLERLRAAGLRLACVTNKAERFTIDLLDAKGLLPYFDVVVSGDSTPRRKPDPMPFLFGCDKLGVTPAEAYAIGDSANDVAAARAAGIRVLCVPYGYNEGEPVADLGETMVDTVAHAAELMLAESREASATR